VSEGPRRRKRRRPAPPAEDTAPPTPAAEDTAPSDDEASAAPDDPAETGPAFARGWPHDEALDALVAAFDAGDYARVRREAPDLARRTGDDAVRRAALELRRRLDPDPIAVYMLLAAAGLLAFLAGWYWLHPHQHTP
jgi:hypothetical protein